MKKLIVYIIKFNHVYLQLTTDKVTVISNWSLWVKYQNTYGNNKSYNNKINIMKTIMAPWKLKL